MSAVVRKSVTDLTRRKARAFFTVLTLALAVASVGIFAVPQLMQQSMEREVAAHRLPDVTVSMKPLRLSAAELAALGRLPNVDGGRAPQPVRHARVGRRAARAGDRDRRSRLRPPARRRRDHRLRRGARPPAPSSPTSNNAQAQGLRRRRGRRGARDRRRRQRPLAADQRRRTQADRRPGRPEQRLDHLLRDAADRGHVERRARLHVARPSACATTAGRRPSAPSPPSAISCARRPRSPPSTTCPVINEPGSYPGKADFESIAGVLGVITLLALLSALVLVSNTMTTLIGEQTGEIAAMKAIGARRRDIRRIYLRTALLLGAARGAARGGARESCSPTRSSGSSRRRSSTSTPASASRFRPSSRASSLGLVGPPLAALPAIRRAARLPLNEALQASGSAVGGQGRLDAALRRVRFLPRGAQIGLRGLGRRKRRSLATALQISVAVATLLALLSLGAGMAQTGRAHFDDNHFDIWIQAVASKPLGADAGRLIASTDGVREAQPWMQNNVRLEGRDAQAWGLPARPLMNTRMEDGRWYTDAEVSARAKVAVLGATIAKTTGKAVGDRIRINTGSGPATLRVIGISGIPGQQRRRRLHAREHAAVGARLARGGQQLLDHHDDQGPRADRSHDHPRGRHARRARQPGRQPRHVRHEGEDDRRQRARSPRRSRSSGC